MINILKVSEIVEMGIEKEKKRRDFYDLASRNFAGIGLKPFFEKLRDWEEAHIIKFGDIKSSLLEDEAAQGYPGELNEYMRVVINEKIYGAASERGFDAGVGSVEDAIRFGIEFEKDAILFFVELLPYVSAQHKEAISALIQEEKKHIVYLEQLREKSKSGG